MSKKHKILKLLNKTYHYKSYKGSNTTEYGKSLSTEEILRKTNLKLDTLNTILNSIKTDKLIDNSKIHGKGDMLFWRITPQGQKALTENQFRWLMKADNQLKLLTFLLALFGTLNSIFHWVEKLK